MTTHKVNDDFFVINGHESNGRSKAYLLWFCAWHPCYVLVYARSFEDALDEAADASDSIPTIAALLKGGEEIAKEAYQEAYDEALAAGKDEDKAQQVGWDAADVDMTPVGGYGGCISSDEWGGNEATREEILATVAETNRRNSY